MNSKSAKRVLFLGPRDSRVAAWLREQGEEVIQTADPIDRMWVEQRRAQWLVSFGYRHILRAETLACFPRRAINLHISYLPYNRGADPNFWSFIDRTPKGVSIHLIDEGVDTGELIAREPVEFVAESETLASTYDKLTAAIESLFFRHWPVIRTGAFTSWPQEPGGSCHRTRDKEPLQFLLAQGWDTPVSVLEEYGQRR